MLELLVDVVMREKMELMLHGGQIEKRERGEREREGDAGNLG